MRRFLSFLNKGDNAAPLAKVISAPAPPPLPALCINAERLKLRPPQMQDWQQWRDVRARNKDILTPFEPAWPDKCLTKGFWAARQLKLYKEWHQDKRYAFLIIDSQTDNLIGGININNVNRKKKGGYATFGYWLDQDYHGRGFMQEALSALCGFCFTQLNLQTLEIACLPHNHKSIAAAERLGFAKKGLKRRYLNINGKRRDHVIYWKSRAD